MKNKKAPEKGGSERVGKVKIIKDGPYLVSGGLPLGKEIIIPDKEGDPVKWKKGEKFPEQETYLLCRCGGSSNKPYCDQSHIKNGFNGTETAKREKYSKKCEKIVGPNLILTDCPDLCAVGRFCHRGGGTWNLTEKSDNKKAKELAIKEACNCPSGRLVAHDKRTGKAIENKYKPSISLVEDTSENVSGPIWVKGGVAIESSDGTKYEKRNRVTLCRCGKSKNKPLCDGGHIEAGFNDGDKLLD